MPWWERFHHGVWEFQFSHLHWQWVVRLWDFVSERPKRCKNVFLCGPDGVVIKILLCVGMPCLYPQFEDIGLLAPFHSGAAQNSGVLCGRRCLPLAPSSLMQSQPDRVRSRPCFLECFVQEFSRKGHVIFAVRYFMEMNFKFLNVNAGKYVNSLV